MSAIGDFAREFGQQHGRRRLAAAFALSMLVIGSATSVHALEQQGVDITTAKAAVEKSMCALSDLMGVPCDAIGKLVELIMQAGAQAMQYHEEINEIINSLPMEFN